jgi:chromosome segregation protein
MRAADAADRVADLATRLEAAETEHARLAEAPRLADRNAADAEQAVREAEAVHRAASETLAAADRRAAAAVQAARAATEAHGESREALVRAEGAFEAAEARFTELGHGGGIDPSATPPSDLSQAAADRARHRVERLKRERDTIGPVNLLAAAEVAAVSEAATALRRNRDELLAAVAKLRGSLAQLERQGRERLEAVFGQVDQRFRDLFARLFGGGRAHLAMVGSDDPLRAGLEIYAQPPGKRLAALSLLSGGEQALTALSLLFAVVQCHAAPVCVLDEVDAPLDDANVDRLGRLLAEMAAQTGTRLVVVTHHPVTMARLDRLYGVTMAERGVSRLLSVDLQGAVEWAGKNAAE